MQQDDSNIFQDCSQIDIQTQKDIALCNSNYLYLGKKEDIFLNLCQNKKCLAFLALKTKMKVTEQKHQLTSQLKKKVYNSILDGSFQLKHDRNHKVSKEKFWIKESKSYQKQKQIQEDKQKQNIINKLKDKICKIEQNFQQVDNSLDIKQKQYKTLLEQYQQNWNKLDFTKNTSFKQEIEDQTELMECLEIDQNLYEQKTKDFKYNLRTNNKDKFRYHSMTQTNINQDTNDNQAIKTFYQDEIKKQFDTESNKKNQTFITEYARYLNQYDKFQLDLKQNPYHLNTDFKQDPKHKQINKSFLKNLRCQTDLINFKSFEKPDLKLEGHSKFKIEKDSFFNNIHKLSSQDLQKTYDKLQTKKKQEKEQTYKKTNKKQPFFIKLSYKD